MRENFTTNKHFNFNCWQEQSLHYNAGLKKYNLKRRSQTHFPDEMYAFFRRRFADCETHALLSTGPGMVAVWKSAEHQYPKQPMEGFESI